MYLLFFKRFFDIGLSIVLLILLLPFLLLIILLIKIDSNGPVFHNSKRIGFKSKVFLMPKFRTMKINTPNVASHKLKNPKKYITKFGAFLRKTSLDEIPQLISVLIGNMSFVGPRPALFNQYDLIKKRKQKKIDHILPGITGLAQIKGRDKISIKKKVDYDHKYLKTCSFKQDMSIIINTFLKMFNTNNLEITH